MLWERSLGSVCVQDVVLTPMGNVVYCDKFQNNVHLLYQRDLGPGPQSSLYKGDVRNRVCMHHRRNPSEIVKHFTKPVGLAYDPMKNTLILYDNQFLKFLDPYTLQEKKQFQWTNVPACSIH